MVSAAFTINGLSSPQVITDHGFVTLHVTSVTGVSSIDWSIYGYYPDNFVIPTITRSGSPSGQTATFTMPASDGYGVCIGVSCTINGGKVNGVASTDCVSKGKISVNDNTGHPPIAFSGEELEGNGQSGWGSALNQALTLIRRAL